MITLMITNWPCLSVQFTGCYAQMYFASFSDVGCLPTFVRWITAIAQCVWFAGATGIRTVSGETSVLELSTNYSFGTSTLSERSSVETATLLTSDHCV